MEELLDKLDVSLTRSRKMYFGCCPVHGGDNPQALNLYPEGDSVPGYWKCNTKGCQRFFKRTILGFIRGVLSRQKFDWSPEKADARVVTFDQTLQWSCEFIGKKLNEIDVDNVEIEKNKFVNQVRILNQLPEHKVSNLTRSLVRTKLKIPATYFVNRGWLPETLNRYDVGLCDDPSKPFFNRVVVPIYDNDYRFVIGFTARSIHNKCEHESCQLYHPSDMDCPTGRDKQRFSKWTNSANFSRESQLYNFWFAKKSIQELGVAILVEGPGESWRLVESGFDNGVAMLGTSLSDQQQVLLETSGAMNIIVVTNNDDAGRQSDAVLQEQLGRAFRLHFPKTEKNDLGESSVEDVQRLIGPIINRIKERGY